MKELEGALACGLKCSIPLMKKVWGHWCYGLYEFINDVARYNGLTFDEVMGNEKQRKQLAFFYRRLGRTPWALYNPTVARTATKGAPLPPLRHVEYEEPYTDFMLCMREGFLQPYYSEMSILPLPPEGFSDAMGTTRQEFAWERAYYRMSEENKKLKEENAALSKQAKTAQEAARKAVQEELDASKQKCNSLQSDVDEYYKPTIKNLETEVAKLKEKPSHEEPKNC